MAGYQVLVLEVFVLLSFFFRLSDCSFFVLGIHIRGSILTATWHMYLIPCK